MILADGAEEETDVLCYLSPACIAKEGISNYLSGAIGDTLNDIAAAITEMVGQLAATIGTFWLFFTPAELITDSNADPNQRSTLIQPPPSSGALGDLLEWVAWISFGVVVLSLMALGAALGLRSRRGEGGEYVSKIVLVMVAAVIIGSASALAAQARGMGPSAGAGGVVLDVQRQIWWYVGAAAVLSVIVGGVRMAWQQSAQPGKELLTSLLTLAVVSGASVTGISMALAAADGFSLWILFGEEGAVDEDFGERILNLLGMADAAGGEGMAVMLVILFGTFASLVAMLQMVLMIFRDGFLIVIAAVLPLAAAFTNTEMGKQWFKKSVAWTIAFILYKPAAAIMYAVAFSLVGETGTTAQTTIMSVVTGLALMGMALIALPALLRLTVPAASLGGAGAAGAMAGAAGVVGGQVASGAVEKASSMGSQASSSPSGGEGDAPTGNAASGNAGGPSGSQQGGGQDTQPPGGTDNPGGDTPPGADEQGKPTETGGTEPSTNPTGAQDGNGTGFSSTGQNTGGPVADGATGEPYSAIANEVQQRFESGAQAVQGVADEATGGPDGSQ